MKHNFTLVFRVFGLEIKTVSDGRINPNSCLETNVDAEVDKLLTHGRNFDRFVEFGELRCTIRKIFGIGKRRFELERFGFLVDIGSTDIIKNVVGEIFLE